MSVADGTIQPRFDDALRPFRRRSLILLSGHVLLWSTLAVGALLILAMWVDLVFALPSEIRWWVSRVGPLVLAVMAAAWFVHRVLTSTSESLAKQIDAAKKTGGEMHAAWQLAARPVQPDGPLTVGLAAMAVDRSRKRVSSFTAQDVFPADSVRRPAFALMMSVAVVIALALIVPGIARHQILRLLSPTADIPPYTGMQIDLELQRNVVLYGENLLVRAETLGGAPERMQLVTKTSEGIENVLPMLPTESSVGDSSRWQAMLSNVTEPLTIHARSGASRSRFHSLDVQMTPQILPPTVRITPPAYTRGVTYEGPIPAQGIEGLASTTIEWRVASNRPLASGRLQLDYRDGTSEIVSLNPSAPSDSNRDALSDFDPMMPSLAGSLSLSKPGRFALSVTDVDGIESQESIEGSITILLDQRPIVRIVSPRPMSLATPNITLPVVVDGADDFGISRMSLFRSLNGSPAREVELATDSTGRQSSQIDLPLNRYGVSAGDEIQLFARIEDNDPAGPKGAESPVTTIRIVSQQDFQELMLKREGAKSLQAKYATAQRYLEKVSEALRDLEMAAKNSEGENPSRESLDKLNETLADAARAASEAAAAMETLSEQAMPIDVDKELAERLAEQAKEMQKLAGQLSDMIPADASEQTPLSEVQQEALRGMSASVTSKRNQLQEQAVDPLQQMQQILPLMMDQQRYTQITSQQRDLEKRLNSLRSVASDDPQSQRRIAELESEQQQLRQALDQLLDDIQSHAESLANEPELEKLRTTAHDFVDALRGSDAMERMSSTQQNLLNEAYDNAHEDADTAAQILESFLSQCNGMGNQACENCELAFKPGMGGASLGNSLKQLMDMMGMKPGSSGIRPGGQPGMGFGWGAGGGYAQRTLGPQNVGMYGALPLPSQSPSRGNGENASSGFASRRIGFPGSRQSSAADVNRTGSAGGQSDQAIPGKYRQKVADYFQQLTEQLGESP